MTAFEPKSPHFAPSLRIIFISGRLYILYLSFCWGPLCKLNNQFFSKLGFSCYVTFKWNPTFKQGHCKCTGRWGADIRWTEFLTYLLSFLQLISHKIHLVNLRRVAPTIKYQGVPTHPLHLI